MSTTNEAFASLARRGLIILTFINILNYVDRYIVAALVESLRTSDLKITDGQAGLLMTSFLVVYMLISPIFGTLGDRISRTRLMSIGVLLWSFATVLGGFANSFFSLLVSRALVGVGEAAYGTIAPALITDYFSPVRRIQAFSIFYSAIPVGAALGYVLGGLMDTHFGWRSAFFVAGVPGLILACLLWPMMDPPRGIHDHKPEHGAGESHSDAGESFSFVKTIRIYFELLKARTYTMTVLGYAAYTFALGALAFWIPAFLERERGLTKDAASTQFGLVVILTGFVGTLFGGWLTQRLEKQISHASLWVSGVATLIAAPFAVGALYSVNLLMFWSCIVIAELLLFMSTGPINLAIVSVVPIHRRATAVALSILGAHVLGDVPSPPLVGWISDRSSLSYGMALIPVAILISGLFWSVEALRLRGVR